MHVPDAASPSRAMLAGQGTLKEVIGRYGLLGSF